MSKASKRRACPAVNREISPAECGENRNSRYPCPADCQFNPFGSANYGQLRELEMALDKLTIQQLAQEPAVSTGIRRQLEISDQGGSIEALHSFIEWKLNHERGVDGLTRAERWDKSVVPRWKNDERVLFRARMGTRAALCEVHRVLDQEQVEAVDLLAEGSAPFLLRDRALAARACRFSVFLCWAHRLPHYGRFGGAVRPVLECAWLTPREVLGEVVRHLGGPADSKDLSRWLAEHYLRVCASIEATRRARHRDMLATVDVARCQATYRVKGSSKGAIAVLDALPAVECETLLAQESAAGFLGARVWFDESAGPEELTAPGARAVLGRVLLAAETWRLESSTRASHQRLRELAEALLGGELEFIAEQVEDLRQQMAGQAESFDPTLVPPVLRANPDQVRLNSSRIPVSAKGEPLTGPKLMEAADRQFLDDRVPALDNHTPREAARDPGLRPRLVQLIKQRIRLADERNLETGSQENVDWLPRELGLEELCFPAPPPRARAAGGPGPVAAKEAPLPPPLPAEPFDVEESKRRLELSMETFKTADDALDAMAASGCQLIDQLDRVTVDLLSEEGFDFVLPFVAQVWFAFVPPGTRAPVTSEEELKIVLEDEMSEFTQFVAAKQGPERFVGFIRDGCQPDLALGITTVLLHSCAGLPKNDQVSMGDQFIMLAVLKTVIEELDCAVRAMHSATGR